jgi:hypothetical protein
MRNIPTYAVCVALALSACVMPKHFEPSDLQTAQASQAIRKALPEDDSPDLITPVIYDKTNDLRTHGGGNTAVAAATDRAVYVLQWDSVENKYLLMDELRYSEIAAASAYKAGAYGGVWLQKRGSYNVILIAVTATGAWAQRDSALQLQKILEERVRTASIASDVGHE